MTTKEFSDKFDTLLNSFSSTPNIVLDEYEKSVFLTKAQEDLVLEIYSGRGIISLSFESTEESRRFLHPLTTSKVYTINEKEADIELPEDLWFITYEECILNDESLGCANGSNVLVTPVRQDDLFKVLKNPFRGPSKSRVLRTDRYGKVQLISDYTIREYKVDYLRKPKPIILVSLGNLSIGGISTISECELPDSIHNIILDRAVQYAISSKGLINNK